MNPPKWSDGGFEAEFRFESFRWEFEAYRFVRRGEGESPVSGLRAKASSSMGKHTPDKAVDGDVSTAWCAEPSGPASGKLTVTLKRPVKLARFSFATGFDAIHEKLGDLWPLNNHIDAVTLSLSGPRLKPVSKNLFMDSERWVDYVPHGDYPVKTFTINVDSITPGTKWRHTCINEVSVAARK